jgi:hypothetical protein
MLKSILSFKFCVHFLIWVVAKVVKNRPNSAVFVTNKSEYTVSDISEATKFIFEIYDRFSTSVKQ